MGILSINTNTPGLVGDQVNPRRCTMLTTDIFSTITQPGYINPIILGQTVLPTDIFDVTYNYNVGTQLGINSRFSLSISNGIITLVQDVSSLDLYTEVIVTSTQFNAMYGTPQLLVAAPGTNLLLVPKNAVFVPVYGTATYTGGGVVNIQYTNIVHGAGYYATSDMTAAAFKQASSQVINAICKFPDSSSNSWTLGQIGNQGLYLSNQTAAFATGDGNLLVHLWYSIVKTA